MIWKKGYRDITWPIRDDIFWISDYVDSKANFVKLSEFDTPEDHFDLVLSPDGCRFPGRRIMESKYDLIGESDHDWYDYFHFNRKLDKEADLYYDVLGLRKDSEYIFINQMASVDVRRTTILDDIKFDLPIIELDIIPGYTLFDWCKVLENAKEIHTVHTGINYIIDKLSLKATRYNMYQGLHSADVQYIPFKLAPTFVKNE